MVSLIEFEDSFFIGYKISTGMTFTRKMQAKVTIIFINNLVAWNHAW